MAVAKTDSQHFTVALEYAKDVVSGKAYAGKRRKQACQRFLDDLASGKWEFRHE